MPRQFKIVVDRAGYPVMHGAGARYIKPNGKSDYKPLMMHRWMVQDTLGIAEYDARYNVHHCDGNKLNFAFDNLVILTADSHRLVHSIGKAEGRWLTKPEILADARFNTDYRTFDVVWGEPYSRLED